MSWNQQTWVSLATWVFLCLLGYRLRDWVIHAIASLVGIFFMLQIIAQIPLVGLGVAMFNVYLFYYAVQVERD
jgi:hypothetical protein